MAQRSKSTTPEPVCIVPMQSDYLVSREMFDDYAEPKVRNSRRWSYPKLNLVSYRTGELTVRTHLKSESFTLRFTVQPDQLSIRCSCRQCGPLLCEHSYHALMQMIWIHRQGYFKKLLPEGPVDFAYRHPKWFRFQWSSDQINIDSRKDDVNVYGFDRPELAKELAVTVEFPQSQHNSTAEQALTYIITIPIKNRSVPAVFPCLGNMIKAGDKIKGFQNYLTGIGKDSDHLLSDKQRALNLLTLELYREVEMLPGRIMMLPESELGKLEHAFDLWRQVFALLLSERHVFITYFFGKRFLRGKPKKQNTYKVVLRPETIKPAFHWLKKAEHYELSLHFTTGDRILRKWNKVMPFYLLAGEELFAWESLRDAAVAEWFPWQGKVVVSKDKLGEFSSAILSVLKRQYTVIESSSK
ncbi:MAG: hypothetical protein ACO1OO_00365 [Flavisolibacter sp.]